MASFPRVYIIAEAGVNHNGSSEAAKELIDIAAQSGADAVKFQTFRAEKMVCKNAAQTQFEMLKKLEINETGHKLLIEHCQKRGIQFLSTPFDLASLDLLVRVSDIPIVKISSGDITNSLLLLKAAKTKKPIILSTGMSTIDEIEIALGVLAFGYTYHDEKPTISAFKEAYYSKSGRKVLEEKVVLLHCTTQYPAPYPEVNLRVMNAMKESFGLPVGLSDHTMGIAIPVAAAAQGAVVIEKHFTLNKNLPGPDHKVSLEPAELKLLVQSIRQVELAFGSSLKGPTVSEFKNMAIARKSLVAARDIQKGEIFTEENLTVKRPGSGISPMYYWDWLGKASAKDYMQDEMVSI